MPPQSEPSLVDVLQAIHALTFRIEGIDSKLNNVEKRFDDVDTRFNGVDKRLEDVNKRLDGFDTRLDGVDKRLDGVDMRLSGIDGRLDGINTRLNGIDLRLDTAQQDFENFTLGVNEFVDSTEVRFGEIQDQFSKMRNQLSQQTDRLDRIEAAMVTKDYLDRKLSDLRADLIMLARKSNKKLEAFVGELVQEGRMSQESAQRILCLEPFPQ